MKLTYSIIIVALATVTQARNWQPDQFSLSSTTFEDGATLPLSAIYNYPVNGSNSCSLGGGTGLDQSPQLSWKHAPRGTHSFVVTTFDVTAGVTHWGMFNIPASITELPENAGVAGSSYGPQVVNVFGDLSYDGPCPPPNYPPNVHHYVFTVYALDEDLYLPSSTNFPASALTLFRELVEAGRGGHILASASITGLYSTTPAAE